MTSKADIVIIGGGMIGSAIAYFLAQTGNAGNVCVIEPDPEYKLAASPVGAGGVRQLFSRPENVQMSQFSLGFYRDFANTMALDQSTPADINFNQRGYLFLVSPSGAKQLEINHGVQTGNGVNALLLDKNELGARFPSLNLSDIELGCLSPDDGTITTTLALKGFRQKAEQLGVTYLPNKVVGLGRMAGKVTSVELEDGSQIQADTFICAAGAWSKEIVAMVGLPLPVEPMCRVKHYWTLDEGVSIEPLPLVKDESGLFFRPQGDGFVGGRPPFDIPSGFAHLKQNSAIGQYFDDYFDCVVRTMLGKRLPAFRNAWECDEWVGHYAQNTLDGNMILGSVGAEAENLYVACGFSGHGIMHSPAVGRAMSELVLNGRFETIDLSRMSYQRVIDDEPFPELGII